MLRKVALAAIMILLCVAISTAQDVGHFDASIGGGAAFGKGVSNSYSAVSVVPTNSALLLGTFRFRFNRMHGIEVNFGRTGDSQIYVLPPDNFRVQARINEYSGAYVFSPFHFQKLDPFVFAGGGALRFSPGNTYIDGFQNTFGATRQTVMAFLYGGGVDYSVWRSLSLRLQYRGLIYRQPTFNLPQFYTGGRGQMPELSLGIVFKF
jgi:opacity protein-like surface antigen